MTLTAVLVLAFTASSFAMVGAEPPAEGEFGIMMLKEGESQNDVDITEVRILQDFSEQTLTYEDLNVKIFAATVVLLATLLIVRKKVLTHTV